MLRGPRAESGCLSPAGEVLQPRTWQLLLAATHVVSEVVVAAYTDAMEAVFGQHFKKRTLPQDIGAELKQQLDTLQAHVDKHVRAREQPDPSGDASSNVVGATQAGDGVVD